MISTKSIQKKWKIIISLLALAGVIALSVCSNLLIISLLRGDSSAVADAADTFDTSVQEWAGNRQMYTGEKNTDTISIPGFDFLNFKADTESQAVSFYNPPANSCYFKISFILDDETLWQSPLLEPGKAVYNIQMNRPLNIGEYTATLKYECFADVKAEQALNGSEVELALNVLK